MTTVHMKHLLAVVGLVTLSLLVLMALIVPAANPTWARADETLNAPSKLSMTNPISIPLVHPVAPIGSLNRERHSPVGSRQPTPTASTSSPSGRKFACSWAQRHPTYTQMLLNPIALPEHLIRRSSNRSHRPNMRRLISPER